MPAPFPYLALASATLMFSAFSKGLSWNRPLEGRRDTSWGPRGEG